MKISEVKEILAGEPDPDQVAELAADERSGVQKLVAAYHKRQEKLRLEQQRFTEMLAYERKYYAQGGTVYCWDRRSRTGTFGRAVGDSGCYFTAGGIYQRT